MSVSPCTGVCRYDDVRRYCIGCGRTLDEIGDWTGADEPRRREIAARAAARLTNGPMPNANMLP